MCGKLRGKCAKLLILQGRKCGFINFSTFQDVENVKNSPLFYTFVKNQGLEKNKFSTFHLTEIIHLKGKYSPPKDLFLCTMNKNQARLRNIKAPRLKMIIDKIKCSIYTEKIMLTLKCS
jgi:hypothetical protein